MGPKQRHEKLELVFNAKDRADFLTGFSKRKQARKKKARLEAEKQYKEEVARIKKEKRDHIRQRLEEVSSVKAANGIELTKLAEEGAEQEKIVDLPQHTVTITYAEEMNLTKCADSVYLGANEDEAVEVIDVAEMEEKADENESEQTGESKQFKPPSQCEQRRSANKVANLAKKTQMLKAKKRMKINENGKVKKSKKKFLRKKIRSKTRNSR